MVTWSSFNMGKDNILNRFTTHFTVAWHVRMVLSLTPSTCNFALYYGPNRSSIFKLRIRENQFKTKKNQNLLVCRSNYLLWKNSLPVVPIDIAEN